MVSFKEFMDTRNYQQNKINNNSNLIQKPGIANPNLIQKPVNGMNPGDPNKAQVNPSTIPASASKIGQQWKAQATNMGVYAKDADALQQGLNKAAAENPGAVKAALGRFTTNDPVFKKAVSKLGNKNFTNSLNQNITN